MGGLHGRRHEHTPPTVQRWKELFGGSCCLWVGSLRGLVRGFGNEGVVLNEGAGDYSFRPVDSELDECKRDPLVALLFRVPNYYRVIEEAVEFGPKSLLKCNWTFPITRHSFGPSTGCLGSQGVGLLVDTV